MLFLWLNLRNENCFWKLFLLLVYSFLLLHISAWGIPRLRTEWQQSSDCRQLCFCLLCMDYTSSVRGSFDFADAALRTTAHQRVQTVMFLFVVYWLHIYDYEVFRLRSRWHGGGGIFNYGVFRLRSSWLIKNIKHKKIRNKFPLWCWHAAQDDRRKEHVSERNASGVERVSIIQFTYGYFLGDVIINFYKWMQKSSKLIVIIT